MILSLAADMKKPSNCLAMAKREKERLHIMRSTVCALSATGSTSKMWQSTMQISATTRGWSLRLGQVLRCVKHIRLPLISSQSLIEQLRKPRNLHQSTPKKLKERRRTSTTVLQSKHWLQQKQKLIFGLIISM